MGKLEGIKVDKSPGLDGLQPRGLKEIAEEILEALVVIFQESQESGRVPNDWKMANVTPLIQKGGKQKTGNYRLVSVTSVIRMLHLLELFEEVMSKLDKLELADVIYLDRQKTFDKASHRRLLNKIRTHDNILVNLMKGLGPKRQPLCSYDAAWP
eukprot:g25192.t1